MPLSRRDLLRSLTFGAAALSTVGFAPAGRDTALRAFAGAAAPGELLQLAVAWPQTEAQRAVLARLDDTHAVVDGGVELLLWPGDVATLTEAGIPFRVTVEDLVARDLAEVAAAPATAPAGVAVPGGISDYADLAVIEAELEALAAAHPEIATVVVQPHPSLEGRTVKGIELAIGDGRDGRPVAYIDGVHHAREWPAAEYCRQFAHHLCETKGTKRTRALLEGVLVRIVPVVNPDGFVLSRSHAGRVTDNANLGIVAGGQAAYQRKNNRVAPVDQAHAVDTAVSPAGEYDAHYGVDPNRNYAYLWGGTTGGLVNFSGPGSQTLPLYASTSPNPTDQTYFGSAPFSEPCTRNTREFFLSHNVITYFSNHTSGQLMLRPWGHTDEPAPDDALLTELGARFSEAMRDPMKGYPAYENKIGLGLYATNGTSNDWAYAATGTLGYVVEHSTSFHPPYFSTHGPGTRAAAAMEQFTRLVEAAMDPRATGRLRGRFVDAAGAPLAGLELELSRTFVTPIQTAGPRGIGAITAGGIEGVEETQTLRLATDADGRIVWFLNPSTRPIVQAGGGAEAYELRVAGGATPLRSVVISRGEVVDLGDVTVQLG